MALNQLHTILPTLMNSIDPEVFPVKASNAQILQLMEEWFIDKS